MGNIERKNHVSILAHSIHSPNPTPGHLDRREVGRGGDDGRVDQRNRRSIKDHLATGRIHAMGTAYAKAASAGENGKKRSGAGGQECTDDYKRRREGVDYWG